MQVLPSDNGEYLSSFFITFVVVVFTFIFYFVIENVFFIIAISCVRNKVYLLITTCIVYSLKSVGILTEYISDHKDTNKPNNGRNH